MSGKGKDGKIIRTGDLAWYSARNNYYVCVKDNSYAEGYGLNGYFSEDNGLSWDTWDCFTQIGPMMGLWDD